MQRALVRPAGVSDIHNEVWHEVGRKVGATVSKEVRKQREGGWSDSRDLQVDEEQCEQMR